MRSQPDDLDDAEIADTLRRAWGLHVARMAFVPKGAGAYHWAVADSSGREWFVSCDDLAAKPWLGDNPDVVHPRLHSLYEVAADLYRAQHLGFVVAPVPARSEDVAGAGWALVDWDTVAMDHPERDLWMLYDEERTAWGVYEKATGRTIDVIAAGFYRLAWKLTDLGELLPHLGTARAGTVRHPGGPDADLRAGPLALSAPSAPLLP